MKKKKKNIPWFLLNVENKEVAHSAKGMSQNTLSWDTLLALGLKHTNSGLLGQKVIFGQYLDLVSQREEGLYQPGFASLCLCTGSFSGFSFSKWKSSSFLDDPLTILDRSLDCAAQCRNNVVSKEKAQIDECGGEHLKSQPSGDRGRVAEVNQVYNSEFQATQCSITKPVSKLNKEKHNAILLKTPENVQQFSSYSFFQNHLMLSEATNGVFFVCFLTFLSRMSFHVYNCSYTLTDSVSL